MFDFHLHTNVSFDSESYARDMADAAARAGLREICFTDHWDDNRDTGEETHLFSLDDYAHAYDDLSHPALKIRRGIEFGISPTIPCELKTEDVLKGKDTLIETARERLGKR